MAARPDSGLQAGTYTISWDENQSGEYTLASGETTIAINDNWFGKELSIVRKGTENTTRDSDAQSLAVPSRPDAPSVGKTDETVDGNNDGAITGTSITMEYRLKAAVAVIVIFPLIALDLIVITPEPEL